MTAPTDAPVEERHRRAAVKFLGCAGYDDKSLEKWFVAGRPARNGYAYRHEQRLAQSLANAERDGRASRDAEVAELQAYKRAWKTEEHWAVFEPDTAIRMRSILAEEFARKGTP
jgi:hypothetical protein